MIDEITERLLSLEAHPLHRYADYLDKPAIQENGTISDGKGGVDYLVKYQIILIQLERELLNLTDELNDEGTNALMSDFISEKEKTTWMFNLWLNK